MQYENRAVQSQSPKAHLHNGAGALGGVAALEDAGADENAVHAHLHHERRVCRRRHTACREADTTVSS